MVPLAIGQQIESEWVDRYGENRMLHDREGVLDKVRAKRISLESSSDETRV